MRLLPPLGRGLLSVFLAAASTAHAQDGTWALTNVRIETVSRGVIERGTIVIRDGLIESVGANITPPADARVVNLTGKTVYPGLIDLTSTLGLPAPPAAQGGGGGGGGGGFAAAAQGQSGQTANVGLEPARLVAHELRPAAADVRGARDLGFTNVLVAPTRGMFRGQSALVPLRDDSATRYVVRSPVALHMGFQGVPGRYPGTLLGVIAYERQLFYDAQRHALMLDRYKAGVRGVARPSYDPALDALVPVVRGTLPVFFAANTENEILRVKRMAAEFDLKVSVVGATEGFRVVDALKGGRPHIVSVDFPRPNDVTGRSYLSSVPRQIDDSARADTTIQRMVEANAATLHKAGIRFALASGGLRPAEFLANVRKAIAAGLPKDVALQAMTIRAAEVAGAAEQLGSIEAGKIANLVVADGDILAENARIRAVFVDGDEYEVIAAPPQRSAGGGGSGASRGGRQGEASGDAAQVGGTWELISSNPDGSTSRATLTVTQTGSLLDGTLRTEVGTVSISAGSVTSRAMTWSASLPIGGQETLMVFRGDIDGNNIRGTVNLGQAGNRTFTGTKTP